MAMDQDQELKSEHSEIRSFVKFVNTTLRAVDVFWVNYSAKLIHYTTLEPTAHCMVNTYVTHPWMFQDKVSGERMHVRHNQVFMPEPWYTNIDGDGRLARKEITVHFPVRTLRENCLWRILSMAREEDTLRELEIPKVLVQELIRRRRNKAAVGEA
ncbi:protein Vhl isoform X1 [Anopheles bellator]|uniref:protein Vhl isoform X1 n=1 Tax=Anopheles bellator TaxID=139047 RepID=UPI002647074C|nr:protein Vhl isoform X1 [Anopheles bellator]